MLLATAACNFSTSQLQKVLRTPEFFSIFTSKCASRYSGVQFLFSPLTTWLRTRRFNEPTFRITRHTNHWKNAAFRDFSNIWRGCIFFLLTFAQLHLLSSVFTSSHLLFICFSTLHIVGSLLFKLPSTMKSIHMKSSKLNVFNRFNRCNRAPLQSVSPVVQKTKVGGQWWCIRSFASERICLWRVDDDDDDNDDYDDVDNDCPLLVNGCECNRWNNME